MGRVAAFLSGRHRVLEVEDEPVARERAAPWRSSARCRRARSGATGSCRPRAPGGASSRRGGSVMTSSPFWFLRAVLEDHDAPLRARLRLALLHHLGLGIDRVAVEDRPRELDLLEPEIAHGGAERRLPHADSPTAMPSVKRLLTSGLPNSAFAAAWKSTWSGCGFMVRQENKILSDSVTVRPGWCRKHVAHLSSSNSLPGMASLLGSAWGRCSGIGRRSGRRCVARLSGRRRGGRPQLVHHGGAGRHAAEQALEVLARRVVQALRSPRRSRPRRARSDSRGRRRPARCPRRTSWSTRP